MFLSFVLCAVNLVGNGGFEAMAGNAGVAGWSVDGSLFSVLANRGRSATRALVWADGRGETYSPAKARVALKPGRRYRFGGWVRSVRLAGVNAAAGFYLDWYSADGKWIGGTGTSGVAACDVWQEATVETLPMPNGTAYGEILAYVTKGSTGEVAFDDVFLGELPFEPLENIWTSAYRNSASGGKVRLLAEANALHGVFAEGSAKIVFRALDAQGRQQEIPARRRGGFAEAFLEVGRLPFGKSPVRCVIETNGVYVASKTVFFDRIDGDDVRKVHFDVKNRLVVEGKRFFPLGMYVGLMEERDVDLLVGAGFNCIMTYRGPQFSEKIMDYCAKRGLKVIYNIKDSFAGTSHHPAWIVDDETEAAWVGEQVSRWRNHPALLAWYVCDESEVAMVPRLRKRQQLLEALDADHPTWSVLYQAPVIRAYMGISDAFGTDPYPVTDLGQYPNAKDGLRRVSDWTRQTVGGLFEGARPVWMVPQYFDWACIIESKEEQLKAKSRIPTYEEARNMCWQCMVGGANGMIVYAYHELRLMDHRTPFSTTFPVIARIAREIGSLTPYFLDGESQALKISNPEVVGRRWRLPGKTLKAVVNVSDSVRKVSVDGADMKLEPLEVKILR